jgi:hypothetical protein
MIWKATMLKKFSLLLLLCLFFPALATASKASRMQKVLDASLNSYALAIRWSDFEAALSSLDPTIVREENFSENVEARFKDIQITGYNLKSAAWQDTQTYLQRVEIRYIDVNTQVEITVTDKQSWRYDATAKRWWLVSDLPKLD